MADDIKQTVKAKIQGAVGAVEEKAGKVLDNPDLEHQGQRDQAEAKVRKAVDDVKKGAAEAIDAAGDKLRP